MKLEKMDLATFALVVFMAMFVLMPEAFALTAPTNGSFAYDVYDIVVDKMLKGPIGFSAGVIAVVIGAVSAIQSKIMLAVPSIVGGVVLLKADSILGSLGVLF